MIATELIFENVLTPLTPAEIVALLSCLLFEEQTNAEPSLPETLDQARQQLVAIATGLANIQVFLAFFPSISKLHSNQIE